MQTLSKRGPDNSSTYIDFYNKVILGHTRLAIIDLDKRSNQPMQVDDCILTFNGEIYNYKKIKKNYLKDFKFKTDSDTEVILALYKTYGTDGFKYLNGMFAFVLYDTKNNKTYFLRDPIGIKPLYYYFLDNHLFISSKVSTIKAYYKNLQKNYVGYNEILALGYPRRPLYRNVYECEPGKLYDEHLNTINIQFEIEKGKKFKDAIVEQFITSDRPVGITLSGGIDSGYIAYICSKYSKSKIHTFTIGFSEKDDDIQAARKLSKYIGSIHHEIIVPDKVYDENLKEGIEKLEHPFDLGSVAMTNLLGKEIAKTDVKVLLVGDGNDEVQGGYKRYSEKQGARTKELWDWYVKRIEKHSFEERKEILKDNTFVVTISDTFKEDNANKILWCDFKNELRYYHLKRIDHIISDFGIEARVPYLDYSVVMNSFDKSFSNKINQRGNKLLLRDEAIAEGMPEEFAFRPKLAFKPKNFDSKKQLLKLFKDQI